MKKLVLISFILVFQLNLFAQKKIVGIVKYYRISPTAEIISMSTSENNIKSLNSRIHKIKIIQDGIVNEYNTNKNGIFNVVVYDTEMIEIIVNDFAYLLKENFSYKTSELKDSVFLNISDRKMANYIDSISSPKFYAKYSEQQASLDFQNGRKRILGASTGYTSEEILKRRKELSQKYGFEYEYIMGCIGSQPKSRIMFRYNEVMKKLIGIKNVW